MSVYENIVLPIELDGEKPNQELVNEIVNTLGLSEKLKAYLTDCLERGRSTEGTPQDNFIPDYPWVQINWK